MPQSSTTNARLDVRLDSRVKSMAERASALLGKASLTDYIVSLVEADAQRIIDSYANMTVEDDLFDAFMVACENVRQPNQALRDAVTFTREQGIK